MNQLIEEFLPKECNLVVKDGNSDFVPGSLHKNLLKWQKQAHQHTNRKQTGELPLLIGAPAPSTQKRKRAGRLCSMKSEDDESDEYPINNSIVHTIIDNFNICNIKDSPIKSPSSTLSQLHIGLPDDASPIVDIRNPEQVTCTSTHAPMVDENAPVPSTVKRKSRRFCSIKSDDIPSIKNPIDNSNRIGSTIKSDVYDFNEKTMKRSPSTLSRLHVDDENDAVSNVNVLNVGEVISTSDDESIVDNDPDMLNLRAVIEKSQNAINVYDDNIRRLNNQMVGLREQMLLIHKEMRNINSELSITLIQREEAKSILEELNERYRIKLKSSKRKRKKEKLKRLNKK